MDNSTLKYRPNKKKNKFLLKYLKNSRLPENSTIFVLAHFQWNRVLLGEAENLGHNQHIACHKI